MADPAALRPALLAWYDANKRDLPWRRLRDPWAVWVSEIMCQQTRVASVIPYFERFMARYPTPADLAAAPLDDLLTLWAGLGYYSRARNLHKAAGQVVARHGGQIPNDPKAFSALAGVGRYTCGAVMSIAFDRPEPVVDGNVVRVFSRLLCIEDDPRQPKVRAGLWDFAARLVPGDRPGDLNQSIMELGALVCRPKSPTCLLCPVRPQCLGFETGRAPDLPVKPKRKPRPITRFTAAFARTDTGDIWLARRAGDGLLGGLWELPAVEQPGELATLGLNPGAQLTEVTHGFTHRVWEITVVAAHGVPQTGSYAEVRAVPEDALASLALSGPGIKALRACGVQLAHRRGAGRKSRA
jgi:A/G-specific adenine glycosylase